MSSNKSVTIYISAAPALAAEREGLARMIAELPVTLAWRIVQTPVGKAHLDLESLRAADLYILVMGADTYAPIGLEWHIAYQAGHPIHAFLKKDGYTPAGQIFIRQTQVNWRPFSQPADLVCQVQRLLIDHLLRYAIEYSLMPSEIERLETLWTKASTDQTVEAEGAGHSAIILSRERFIPSGGIVVDE